jgi:hypothetical protein
MESHEEWKFLSQPESALMNDELVLDLTVKLLNASLIVNSSGSLLWYIAYNSRVSMKYTT